MSDIVFLSPFPYSGEPEPILRDVFDGWSTGAGIFDVLSTLADMPWKDVETVRNASLDIAYFGNHSGGKFCSPLVKLFLDENGHVPADARVQIGWLLISKYINNWRRLWDTNVVAYTPIHNYDMTERRGLRSAKSSAVVDSRNATDTTTHGKTTDEMDYKFGLNTDTSDPKPSDKVFVEEGGETGVESNSNGSTNSVGAAEEDEEIHRSGNIGVTTTQKLLEEERQLWIWNYFDEIFKDLDRKLALMFHDSCRV